MNAVLRAALLWTRGLIFTALVPLVIAGWVPRWLGAPRSTVC